MAQGWTWSGRTVRESEGVLKGLRKCGVTIIAEALDLALIRPPGAGRGQEVERTGCKFSWAPAFAGEAEGGRRPLSRVTPILGSSPRMTDLLSPP